MSDIIKVQRSHLLITDGLIFYLSIVYLFAKSLELLIHRLGSPRYVVTGVFGCTDFFPIKIIFLVNFPTFEIPQSMSERYHMYPDSRCFW